MQFKQGKELNLKGIKNSKLCNLSKIIKELKLKRMKIMFME